MDVKEIIKKKPGMFDEEIKEAIELLESQEPGTKEYDNTLKSISNLLDLNKKSKRKNIFNTVSADTIAVCACNLIGIAVILGYEHYHPITSKAFGWIFKPRI